MASVGPLLVPGRSKEARTSPARRARVRPRRRDSLNTVGTADASATHCARVREVRTPVRRTRTRGRHDLAVVRRNASRPPTRKGTTACFGSSGSSCDEPAKAALRRRGLRPPPLSSVHPRLGYRLICEERLLGSPLAWARRCSNEFARFLKPRGWFACEGLGSADVQSSHQGTTRTGHVACEMTWTLHEGEVPGAVAPILGDWTQPYRCYSPRFRLQPCWKASDGKGSQRSEART